MRHASWVLGVACSALAMAGGGCAETNRSLAVPVEPVAEGQAAPLITYGVALSGSPGGAVEFGAGRAEHEARHLSVVHVSMTVRNDARAHDLYLVPADLWLEGLGPESVAATSIDGKGLPARLAVAPGKQQTFDVAFKLPPRVKVDDVHNFQVRWALDASGSTERVERRTQYAANEPLRTYGALSVNPNGSKATPGDMPAPSNNANLIPRTFPARSFNTARATRQGAGF